MARPARDHWPDVDHSVVLNYVVAVVPVDRARSVPRHELAHVADVKWLVRPRLEETVLLVEPESLEVVPTDRGQHRRAQGFVSGVEDDPVGRPADHRRQYEDGLLKVADH